MAEATLTDRIGEYDAAASFDDVPAKVVERVQAVFLHHIAVGLGGCSTDQGRLAVSFIQRDDPAVGDAPVIGQSFHTSALNAVFANGTLMRALRMDDTLLPSGAHPGPSLFSTALDIGQRER